MKTFLNYLKKYIDLTEEENSILVSKLKRRDYLKGQYILQSEAVCQFQTFIVSGKVRSFYLDKNGNEYIVMFGLENWWVGDLGSFTNQTPADLNIQCLENTEVIQISYDNFQQICKEVPKMERFFRLIIQNAYVKTQKRVIQNHSLTARERYELFCKEYPAMVQRIPQYMIASYLGITKEFLSSIRNQKSKS